MDLFELCHTSSGVLSIRNNLVNEIMHNPVGPWVEANALYVQQPQLQRLLQQPEMTKLVIFDVGLGAAANAIAAISCASLPGTRRRLHLLSFEQDLRLLEFAYMHRQHFPHLLQFEKAISDLLTVGQWQSANGFIHWELCTGDFLEQISRQSLQPHLVFYDPYSPAVNQEMWSMACFQKLHFQCRNADQGGTLLMTYSLATSVRTALLGAGFLVGYGQATGLKKETTQAATALELLNKPLDQRWLARWQKSDRRYPWDCSPENQKQVDQKVLKYFAEQSITLVP